MKHALTIVGMIALIGFGVLSVAGHEQIARDAFIKAGYNPTGMKREIFGACMKGRSSFIVPVENGSKVKVCVGGFSDPVFSVLY